MAGGEIFFACVRDSDEAVISDVEYLRAIGVAAKGPMIARDVWRAIAATLPPAARTKELDVILSEGCLARRMMKALGASPGQAADFTGAGQDRLRETAMRLAECLEQNQMFVG